MVLKQCHLEQHYQYLYQNGFTSLESLKLLNISDHHYLNEVSLGHLKLIIKTTKLFVERNIKITSKYEEYLKSLEQFPDPIDYFPDIDDQIAHYNQIKQKYIQNWPKHSDYHLKLTNALKTSS